MDKDNKIRPSAYLYEQNIQLKFKFYDIFDIYKRSSPIFRIRTTLANLLQPD